MSYASFCQRVSALIERVGGITAEFEHDEDSGKHIAILSDGTRILGNSTSLKVTFRYGSGHQLMAQI